MELKFKAWGSEHNGILECGRYEAGGHLYIGLWSNDDGYWEPYANLTVNLFGTREGYSFVDTNNFPQVLDLIGEYNLGTLTGRTTVSGWCTYPEVKWDLDEVMKYCMNKEEMY